MLEELHLRGVGVIEDAVLELSPGFTAITGETGAGKTMVLSGLGLLLGARADAGLVRAGHDRAEVEGRLRVDPAGPVAARAAEAGASLDDGEVLVAARVVTREGRSRAHLGGRSVPVGLLTELADDLVAVHGQADQRGLLRPGVQRGVLDRYGRDEVAAALAGYRSVFDSLTAVRTELAELTARRRERAREADLLRHGLAEIAAVGPSAGEDHALRAEIGRLGNVDALRAAGETARRVLSGDGQDADDVQSLLGAARAAVEAATGRDPALDALGVRLAEVSYLVADLAADLAGYLDGVDADPRRLDDAQRRLADLVGLTRKYGADVDEVLRWAADSQARLDDVAGDDERVEDLAAEHARLSAALAQAAIRLTAVRRAAAGRLEAAVTAELAALSMPGAGLRVEVRQRDDAHGLEVAGRRLAFGPTGTDEVELLLSGHPGAPARPLHRGASGGELSRVMLALEVVLAGSDPVPTFVFDEVDAGVGGQAAVEVGRRLAALSRTAQVIVVTHLPQVAAFADRQLVVDRVRTDGVTTTSVRSVSGPERVEELSRMLAGMPDSDLGRGHAEELLAVAAASTPGA